MKLKLSDNLNGSQEKMEPKNDPERRQHVPYILNGELYRIENQVGDNVTVKCCYCPPDRIYRGSVRSTGNFHMHIKRRHSSLLGKLHEMKVAALEERRDRIMKNRRFGKPRKKTPTPTPLPTTSAAAQSNSGVFLNIQATPAGNESHELKIKTVFQRHKQEQEGATRRSGDSTSDNSVPANPPNIPNSLGVLVQDLPNISVETLPLGSSAAAASVSFLGRPVKPEQAIGSPFLSDQPTAIDLSRAPSVQGESKSSGSLASSMEDVSMGYSRSQSISQSMSLTHFLDHPQRDVLQRLERTMAQISQELHCRNRIEHNRMLLEAAKFKFLNPNFQFEPNL
ncbi:protein stand still isoform X1 [Drosophila subpulchrella]|uniref:protein stand still isoform X1 n=1 Tax=Drosophila subpulchrella TaxID=1486046 RepID=UPI0018A15AEC|nr:protein stand still isoform X1 [Drosophila subpulchrella]